MRRKDIKDNPNLRFPEFSEPYIYKSFGELLTREVRSFKMEDESEYRLVTVKRGYGGVVLRGIFKGKEVLVKSQFLLKTGDFLISKRQICHNACGIVPSSLEGAIVSNEYTVFLPKKDLDIVYFRYFCCLPIISHTFFLSSIGVHIEKMLFKVDDWLKWEFPFPSLPEQQKIASFLLVVDKKIEQLTRKKELLEQYKKGVMQKIFSQEIRFKDENGQDYPAWVNTTLKEHCILITKGTTPSQFISKGINYIKTECIEHGIVEQSNCLFIENEIHFGELKRSILKENDILFAIAGSVGKTCVIPKHILPANTNQALAIIRLNHTCVLKYFTIIFKSEYMSKYISKTISVGAQPNLNLEQLGKFNFPLPAREEQEKIANFLSSIDDKINSLQTQLTQTQNFKKGLLQKMFV